MQRAITGTALFILGAIIVTAVSGWVAYQRVSEAFARELGRRLELVARTAASQIDTTDVAELRRFGRDSDRFLALELLFLSLQRAGGVAGASLLDPDGTVMADAGGPEREGRRTPLDSLASAALAAARAGRTTLSAPYRSAAGLRRAALVPVTTSGDSAHPIALVAVEGDLDYGRTLGALGQSLALLALVSFIALAVLGTLFVRVALSAAQLEQRLSRAQNMAAMGQMTATLAHEIRNPLGIIRNAATRLGQLDVEARPVADYVVEEVDRLHHILNRYLEFARGGEEASGAGDARASLRATLSLLESEMRSRGIALEANGTDGTAPVRLASDSLKQVYLNLLLNALEAMPQGGRLRVAVGERRGRFEIAFADSGTGMSEETMRRTEIPFFTTKPKGSGLGLALTRRLLRSAGGDLRLDSEPGRGTTCTVMLPKRSP